MNWLDELPRLFWGLRKALPAAGAARCSTLHREIDGFVDIVGINGVSRVPFANVREHFVLEDCGGNTTLSKIDAS